MDLCAAQIEAEQAASASAEAEAIRTYLENLKAGNVDKLPKAKMLIGNMFPAVHDSIVREQGIVARGPGAKVRGWLREIPADVGAVIAMQETLRLVLCGGFRTLDGDFGATFQRIAVHIGRHWVREIQVQQAEKVNPAYLQAAQRGLERAHVESRKHIQATVDRVIRNTLDGVYDCPLDQTQLMQLGKFGLAACVDAGLVEVVRGVGALGQIVTYALPEAVERFLGDTRAAAMAAPANKRPMCVPPLPWRALRGGGFYTERQQIVSPMLDYRRRVRRDRVKAYHAANSIEQMPLVYQYVNYVQSVPFTVNRDVFAHLLRIWQNGGGAMGIPNASLPVAPPFPFAEDWQKATAPEGELAVFRNWKRAKIRWHEAVREHRSTMWAMVNFIQAATLRPGEPCYFPAFLDGRGRLYYRCTPTPQGSDANKAVLHFANRKPLGERGVFWLKVHIANCFGQDKESFEARASWTEEHWERLQGSVERPEDSGVYEEADSPMMALAAVLELSNAYAAGDPAGYASGLPVHMDATCSGLQHFSAMLRDEVGGQYVNLYSTPGQTRKADIYAKVAESVMVRVSADAATGVALATEWLTLGVPRALAKGPVMTYVYGATLLSVTDGIEEWLMEQGWRKEGLTLRAMAVYLAKLFFVAIEETVPAAAAAMRQLRRMMKDVPRDAPVQWVTPLGLTVNHDYPDEERTRVRVRSAGVEYVVMYKRLDKTLLSRMQNAISPNFVHSLDATHLGMTALRMQAEGLEMVCIHDSFGTHPCDVDAMHRCIREAFVQLYQRDMLADLASQLGLDVTDKGTGNLDLHKVLDSQFFFC